MKFFRLFITFIPVCFAFLSTAKAVVPAPDGGYPGFTTAEGANALQNLTTGVGNTATGWHSLFANSAGNLNTAVGAGTLLFNAGDNNTATGALALLSNTTGFYNTADGAFTLLSNTEGDGNTASGYQALYSNTSGSNNAAFGYVALYSNTDGDYNTALGSQTLVYNTRGSWNTATGYQALLFNTTGEDNTAVGVRALLNNTAGHGNIALGNLAGQNVNGSNNIVLGNDGVSDESDTIRIGNDAHTAVYIPAITNSETGGTWNSVVVNPLTGRLYLLLSSRRFKRDIQAMDKSSEGILSLKPVAFHYKSDKTNTLQFGLIAEEVAQVNPDLVVRDKEGNPHSVRYDAVNAMLLNEFLKEHRKNEEQQATIAELKQQIVRLAARDEEQAAQIQKVSAQLEVSKAAPQTVLNNQ